MNNEGLNCTICKYSGKCKAWKDEKEYFDQFPQNLPPERFTKMFVVTEQGVQCSYFEVKK